jgi:hypothetical protein
MQVVVPLRPPYRSGEKNDGFAGGNDGQKLGRDTARGVFMKVVILDGYAIIQATSVGTQSDAWAPWKFWTGPRKIPLCRGRAKPTSC